MRYDTYTADIRLTYGRWTADLRLIYGLYIADIRLIYAWKFISSFFIMCWTCGRFIRLICSWHIPKIRLIYGQKLILDYYYCTAIIVTFFMVTKISVVDHISGRMSAVYLMYVRRISAVPNSQMPQFYYISCNIFAIMSKRFMQVSQAAKPCRAAPGLLW